MVARKFIVRHEESEFDVEYDTEDGLEVLKFQIFSLTSVPPEHQKILGEEENRLVEEDSDLDAVSEKLRLMSVAEEAGSSQAVSHTGMSDEELARLLQAEEEALFFQQYRASDNREEFGSKVRPYVSQVLKYEDPIRIEAARKSIPVDELEEKALVSLAKEGNFRPSRDEEAHSFLLQLLYWFKGSFRWVNSPPCDGCGSETSGIGMGVALPSEIQFGGSRVELYRCNRCSRITRFPRYNDPLKLLETRKGRCGEWANCFTFYCRAFGYDARLILDFTDHVWTECFSPSLERWMHLDPCEGVYDNPLLYEKGWQKKLSYVIAISKDGVLDVTKRYTRKWHEVLSRRNITTEDTALSVLSDITKECRRGYTAQAISTLEQRDKKEIEDLERNLHLSDDASISLPGRQSGAKEWRIARSEYSTVEERSLSNSLCSVRTCVDNHVGSIYNAFSGLLSHMGNSGLSKDEILETLDFIRRLLVDLKSSPFKMRKASITSDVLTSQHFKHIASSMDELLSSLSLKKEMEMDGRMLHLCLAAEPVQTSIALPVFLDILTEIIEELNKVNNFDSGVLLKFLKFNRITSGEVLASGEEIPFGIATSAFDGIHASKWEEPNGAKGCWLIYKVMDGVMHELEGYDLMSANDVPERDPMDWVLEGSDDGGANWNVLDKQSSQIFGKRFERKMYKINLSARRASNAFRFRFLAVRNGKDQSRFQIGSIDLYAKGT
ncbi:Peptide-N(4)-(N-acetyl-beta-glucosaminyl)asparagine amidase [Acorus gramineus]|uniref:Peptide-N(4)-(N-acetyl-beta-glucosaminyl)asparagine amidase n=1 Tax=Acorus gramineus TaxID=55184 RepID=A0AAV9BVW3_ACOGR|nr:Peptide-N(4)-(N-acetyl-beta-glucosaminyl)asparagine amidase [Acorus gramineus]